MKMGTAPASITVFVCMDVPDAMLVNAHAASNCNKRQTHRTSDTIMEPQHHKQNFTDSQEIPKQIRIQKRIFFFLRIKEFF